MEIRERPHDVPKNRCYCNYDESICGKNKTCVKKDGAACYHAVEEVVLHSFDFFSEGKCFRNTIKMKKEWKLVINGAVQLWKEVVEHHILR